MGNDGIHWKRIFFNFRFFIILEFIEYNLVDIFMVVRTPEKDGIHLEFENYTWKTLKTWNLHVKI